MRRGNFYFRVVWSKSRELVMKALVVYALVGTFAAEAGADNERVGIARAIDGDTIAIDSESIRFRNIDAPEITQTCKLRDGRMLRAGRAARKVLQRLISGRVIRCVLVGRDRYQRHIGYCISDDGVYIEKEILAAGFAVLRAGVDAPDLARASRLAERDRRGMFACERGSDGRIHFENAEGR